MIKIEHPLIGPLEYEEESVITFQEGIIGLEENKRWLLLQNPKHQPFQWLQSIDNPEITLMVIDPWIVRADYSLSISLEDQARVNLDHLPERQDWAVLCVVVFQNSLEETIINLKAPLLFNLKERKGRQVIMEGEEYQVEEPLFSESARRYRSDKKGV